MDSATKSEVFDLNTGKSCQDLAPFPIEINGAIGETVKGFPLICGGRDGSNEQQGCYLLKNNAWSKIGDMREARRFASMLLLANNTLWILGGTGSPSTSELLDLDSNGAITQQTKGPDLPEPSSGHCAVRYEHSKAILMGGWFKNKTYIYNLEAGSWTEGPQLQDSGNRYYAACGQIIDKGTSKQ